MLASRAELPNGVLPEAGGSESTDSGDTLDFLEPDSHDKAA